MKGVMEWASSEAKRNRGYDYGVEREWQAGWGCVKENTSRGNEDKTKPSHDALAS